MIKKEIDAWRTSLGRGALVRTQKTDQGRRDPGHAHFWERALSRRRFIQATGGAAAGMLILGSGHWMPASAAVPGNTPKPIPGGFTFPPLTETFHNFAPGVFDPLNTDRSGIFDFNGHIGYAIIDGTGTGSTGTGPTTPLEFEVDLRFMQGVYVGVDGKHRHATFCLI